MWDVFYFCFDIRVLRLVTKGPVAVPASFLHMCDLTVQRNFSFRKFNILPCATTSDASISDLPIRCY